jgi:GTP-binding protein
MFDKQEFIKSVFDISNLPMFNLPEVILCGRSNVGKSSFINSLFNRKNLAKISSTPGKTRSINYYLIDEKFYLVDLPGFGYAKISKQERENWANLIEYYFDKSESISLAFHFIDSRHKPTELDVKLNSLLNFKKIPYIIILSKVDKLKQSEYNIAKKLVIETLHGIDKENIINYSSQKKIGRKEILKTFTEMFYRQNSQ